MIALLVLSRRRSIMGEFTTGPMMSVVAAAAAVGVLALNTVLLAQSLGVAM
jgi:manganese transport protein